MLKVSEHRVYMHVSGQLVKGNVRGHVEGHVTDHVKEPELLHAASQGKQDRTLHVKLYSHSVITRLVMCLIYWTRFLGLLLS